MFMSQWKWRLDYVRKDFLDPRCLGKEGQTTIEFFLAMILMVAFLLFYFQLGSIFAFGNYVHYATFMAARAYLAASDNPGDQTTRANNYLTQMLKKSAGLGTDKYPGLAKGFGGSDGSGATIGQGDLYDPAQNPWAQGVSYQFKSRLFIIPLAGLGQKMSPSVNQIVLKSESWLGREPTRQDCQSVMQGHGWIYDNGC